MKKACVLLMLLGGFLAGCPSDPYNDLIWNRANALQGNGQTDRGPWFEWWYYKVILPDTGDAFYFVYGVVNPWDTAMANPGTRAFVGVGNFAEKDAITQPFAVTDFSASYFQTDVRIAEQHATDVAISGSVDDGQGGVASWNVAIARNWRFNAMGWAMFPPDFSNIYWYPAQADARFTGQIVYRGKTYTFQDAPGYQDRNWGRSFPHWWAWIVANHFSGHPDTALVAGGGQPTLLGTVNNVEGLAIGLKHNGTEYAFRPSDGDAEQFTISFGVWQIEAVNLNGYKLELEADAPCDSFLDLVFPTPQGTEFHDFESLTGSLTARLYVQDDAASTGWRLLDELHSDFAGIEYGSAGITAMDCHEKDSVVLYSNF